MKSLRKLYHGCTEGTDVQTRTPFIQRFACGVGHVINDIMRQLQFSFRLVFFMQVLGLSAEMLAGWHSRKNWLSLLPRLSVHSWWIESTSHFCRGKLEEESLGIWSALCWASFLCPCFLAHVTFVRTMVESGKRS